MSTASIPSPHPTQDRRGAGPRPGVLSHGSGFWAVAFAFVVIMGYSAVPTPLYGLYAARDGFGALTITIVFAVYALGVIASLYAVGHLSDHLGRRRLLTPALLLSAASSVVFLLWRDLPGLVVARFASGLAVGAVTATATAWLAELHATDRPGAGSRRAEVVGISANVGGIGVGPLVAGALAQWVDHPLTIPYVVFGALLLLAAGGAALSPETRWVAPQDRPAYRPQELAVPERDRAPFLGALGAAFLAFAAFGLFTSLAPAFLAGALGHPSHALAGFAAFAVFTSAVLSQLALTGRGSRGLIVTGTAGLILGTAATVLAVWLPTPSLALFLLGGVVLGVGAGGLFKGALATIIRIADPARRAGTLVVLFFTGYVGLAIPAVGLGVLTQQVQPRVGLLVFGGLLVAGMLASLAPLLRASKA